MGLEAVQLPGCSFAHWVLLSLSLGSPGSRSPIPGLPLVEEAQVWSCPEGQPAGSTARPASQQTSLLHSPSPGRPAFRRPLSLERTPAPDTLHPRASYSGLRWLLVWPQRQRDFVHFPLKPALKLHLETVLNSPTVCPPQPTIYSSDSQSVVRGPAAAATGSSLEMQTESLGVQSSHVCSKELPNGFDAGSSLRTTELQDNGQAPDSANQALKALPTPPAPFPIACPMNLQQMQQTHLSGFSSRLCSYCPSTWRALPTCLQESNAYPQLLNPSSVSSKSLPGPLQEEIQRANIYGALTPS